MALYIFSIIIIIIIIITLCVWYSIYTAVVVTVSDCLRAEMQQSNIGVINSSNSRSSVVEEITDVIRNFRDGESRRAGGGGAPTYCRLAADEPAKPEVDDGGHSQHDQHPTARHDQRHEQTKVVHRRNLCGDKEADLQRTAAYSAFCPSNYYYYYYYYKSTVKPRW